MYQHHYVRGFLKKKKEIIRCREERTSYERDQKVCMCVQILPLIDITTVKPAPFICKNEVNSGAGQIVLTKLLEEWNCFLSYDMVYKVSLRLELICCGLQYNRGGSSELQICESLRFQAFFKL